MTKKIFGALLALLMLVPLFAASVSAADEVISVGKDYTVEYSIPIDNTYPKKAYKEENKLTDGKSATSDSLSDTAWLALYRGNSVSVTIDLEEVMAVNKVELGQFQYKTAGVICSRYIKMYVSEDGETYGFAGEMNDGKFATYTAQKRVKLVLDLKDKYFKARYVRIEFSSDVFTYVDEISVYGNSDTDSAITPEPYVAEDKGLSGDIDGIKSVCLMYIASNYSADVIKPYFAYVDASGAVKDTMFDSLLFLGMNNPYIDSGKKSMTMEGMQRFVDDCLGIDKNVNASALNKVVGDLKAELKLGDDYKYPIFLTVPTIPYNNEVFGEIDGSNVKYDSLFARSKIVKWCVDYIETAFEAANFDNLSLKGIYWFAESIDYSDSTHEEELVKYFNDYCHDKGYKTMWIPYYSSAGVDVSKSLGFDSVTMQSGYAFENASDEVGQPKEGACYDAAQAAKKFGLNGTEFEVDMGASKYDARLAKYISAAYGAGVMENGMITMYQVGDNLYRSSVGSGASGRKIYDLTYQFISGQYKESAPVIKDGATVTLTTNDYVTGRLDVVDEDTNKSNLKIAHFEKPEGIYFSASGNGFFEVQTYNSKPGTYTARLSVTDGSNESNIVEITIIVEPSEGEVDLSTDASAINGNDGEGNNTLWIILAVVGGLVVLAGAAFAVVKIRSSKKDK